jgi:hypothetical protein
VREMNVRDRLRFHSLRGIHDQERAFAGRERTRNFVGEIDVPRCIEQIQPVFFARLRTVLHRYWVRFDRDPAFAFQIHGIEQLILFFALVDRAGALEQSIRQGGLSVIDVRDDAEIARLLDSHEAPVCGCAVERSIYCA